MAEIESEGELHRGQIATFLREFADELDPSTHRGDTRPGTEPHESDPDATRDRTTADDDVRMSDVEDRRSDDLQEGDLDRMTIVVGGNSATLTLPEVMEFEVEVESRSPLLSSGVTQGISFDLEWEVDEPHDDESMEVM